MPRNQALRHLFRPMDDTQLLRHPRALGSGRTAQAARRLVLTKRFHELLLQTTTRMRVDSGVDCFVAHALTWIIRMHGLELGSNLLGRPTIQNQVVTHLLKERTAFNKPAPSNAGPAAQPIVAGCAGCRIARCALSPYLAQQRARTAIESPCNGVESKGCLEHPVCFCAAPWRVYGCVPSKQQPYEAARSRRATALAAHTESG